MARNRVLHGVRLLANMAAVMAAVTLPSLKIFTDALGGDLTLAFNINGGDTDVRLPIDMTVASTDDNGSRQHSSEQGLKFLDCLNTLVKGLKPTK